jgi:tetratricopeptide (TPR) repeat protein
MQKSVADLLLMEEYLAEVTVRYPKLAEACKLQRDGKTREAQQIYGELVAVPALTAICLHQMAVMAATGNDLGRAVDLFRHSLRLDPGQLHSYDGLAYGLGRLGRTPAALGALLDKGGLLQTTGRYAQAQAPYREILAVDPLYYGAYVNLGTCLALLHQLPEALWHLLGALDVYGRIDTTVADFCKVLRQRLADMGIRVAPARLPAGHPTGAIEKIEDAITTLGKVMTELRLPQEAILCHRRAVLMAPGFALAHWNLSLALLMVGDFSEGWKEYEWRWHWQGFPESTRRLPFQKWRGEPLQGKSIFVWAEQGFGDAMQFAPLARRLVAAGAQVVLEVTTPLFRLFQSSFPEVSVVERSVDGVVPALHRRCDLAAGLLSLPNFLALQRDELPLANKYFVVPQDIKKKWVAAVPGRDAMRVGIVWAGRPIPDLRRTVPYTSLTPLFNRRTFRWFSLQVGPQENEIPIVGNAAIEKLGAKLTDFAETAAAMERMDLIITIDSATAHLAGGLGKTVWLLLPWVTDWRWAESVDGSPWYPSMRIFQQPSEGNWSAVIDAVGHALDALENPVKQ